MPVDPYEAADLRRVEEREEGPSEVQCPVADRDLDAWPRPRPGAEPLGLTPRQKEQS